MFKVNSKSLDLIVLEIDERSEEILLIFSIELLILSLLDFTMDLIIALVSFKSVIVSEKSEKEYSGYCNFQGLLAHESIR